MAPTTRRPPPPPEGGRRSTRESNPSPLSHGTVGDPSTVNAAVAGGRLNGFVERASAEVVGVTYWFTPATAPVHQSVTLRFTGRRLDIDGSPSPRDQFVHDELVSDILAGSGPVAVTAKIGDVNSGQWDVRAKMLPAGRPVRPGRGRKAESVPGPLPVYPASCPGDTGVSPRARLLRSRRALHRWSPLRASSSELGPSWPSSALSSRS